MFQLQELLTTQIDAVKRPVIEAQADMEKFISKLEGRFDVLRNDKHSEMYMLSMEYYWELVDECNAQSLLPGMKEFSQEASARGHEFVKRFMKLSDRKFLSTKEAADKFNRHRSTIYRWIKAGKIDAKKVNGRWRILA